MEKVGKITLNDKKRLEDITNKYYKRYKSALHPCFIVGVKYALKHLNTITTENN